MRAKIALAAVAAVMMVPLAAHAGGGCSHQVRSTSAKGIAVDLSGACFTPTILWVAPGKTVTWTNREGMQHTVTGTGFVLDSGDMNEGDRYSFTFRAAGIFPYACIYHPGMVGAVIVGSPVAPKIASALGSPGNGEGIFQKAGTTEQASTAVQPAATVVRPDPGATAAIAVVSAALVGAMGFAFGRRHRRSEPA